MKKLLALFLSVAILTSALSIAASAIDKENIGFAVASDLHYKAPRAALDGNIDDPIYWYSNRRAAMEDESPYIIDEFLNQCAADDKCGFVLISGDMSNDGRGRSEDHLVIAEKFRKFEEKTGKQIYVVPGNHDYGMLNKSDDTDCAVFKSIYSEFGYDEAINIRESDCSYTAELPGGYRLIALDSCDPKQSTGDGINAEKLKWVYEQAMAAKADGKHPILMMHHNLLDHMPVQSILSNKFIVRFHTTIAELFADWGIKLVFTGHEHCSDAAVFTSALGNKIYDFATTSLTMYPLGYRMFYPTENEIRYESKYIEKIDTDALKTAVSGYSDEQIALMNSGLNSYSKGFFKAGIKYRLSLSLSMDKIGISEDEPFYSVVNAAIKGITNIFEMPLYGENSVCELAKKYGIEIPDSDYSNVWDIATEIVGAHYAGGEKIALDSPEMTILLHSAALILRTDLSAVSDEVFFNALDAVTGKLGYSVSDKIKALGVSAFGSITPGEYFLLALVSPLLYDFTFDSDGVDDNNGVIEGYAVTNNIVNIHDKINDSKTRFSYKLNLMLKYILKALISLRTLCF
jgi:3',5'-cyclic AMP phosphodiesterase CpdA